MKYSVFSRVFSPYQGQMSKIAGEFSAEWGAFRYYSTLIAFEQSLLLCFRLPSYNQGAGPQNEPYLVAIFRAPSYKMSEPVSLAIVGMRDAMELWMHLFPPFVKTKLSGSKKIPVTDCFPVADLMNPDLFVTDLWYPSARYIVVLPNPPREEGRANMAGATISQTCC